MKLNLNLKKGLLLFFTMGVSLICGIVPSHAQIVFAISTVTTIQITDPQPIVAGQYIHYVITVTALGQPVTSGYISLSQPGSAPFESVPLGPTGQFILPLAEEVGPTPALHAHFEGSGHFLSSDGDAPIVQVIKAATMTHLTVWPNTVVRGQSVTFVATVTPVLPSTVWPLAQGFDGFSPNDGLIALYADGQLVESVHAERSGTTQFMFTPSPALRIITFSASYSGGGQYIGSASNPVFVTVVLALPK